MHTHKRKAWEPTAQDFRTSGFGFAVVLCLFFLLIVVAMVLS